VFLSSHTDVNEVGFLLRSAVVVSPRDFSALDSAGDDVFLCEYEYDCKFRLFRRCSERDAGEQDVDWDWDVKQDECAPLTLRCFSLVLDMYTSVYSQVRSANAAVGNISGLF
jgi:hypothetical protein